MKLEGIPVLMYHALEDEQHPSGAKNVGEQLYVLHVKQFKEQMEYLYNEGFQTFLLTELASLQIWPDKAVVLTFDDGHLSNYTLALQVLQSFGFKAEFFITTGWIGTSHFMNADHIKILHRSGMGIGSHGVTHHFLTDLSKHLCEQEIKEASQALQLIIEKQIVSFSAPGGRMSQDVKKILIEAGYKFICTSRIGPYKKATCSFSIPRLSITSNCTIDTYRKMILLRPHFLTPIIFGNRALSLSKSILGNQRYEYIRSLILRNRHKQSYNHK